MIRVVNAQGFVTLTNTAGVAFQLNHPLARALYRAAPKTTSELRNFLVQWGGDAEGITKLLDDEFTWDALGLGFSNLGLTLETLRDLLVERDFFEAVHDRHPRILRLSAAELGIIGTALAKEGRIEDVPLRHRRDDAAADFLRSFLSVDAVEVSEGLPLGEFA